MNIQQIKEINEKIKVLEKLRYDLKEINKIDSVNYVTICNYQKGADHISYDITIDNKSFDFLLTIKDLITSKLKRDEERLSKEIDNL